MQAKQVMRKPEVKLRKGNGTRSERKFVSPSTSTTFKNMTSLTEYVDFSQKSLWIAVGSIIFVSPLFQSSTSSTSPDYCPSTPADLLRVHE